MTTVLRTTVRLHEPEAEFVADLKRHTVEADAFSALTDLTEETVRKLPAGTLVNVLVEVGMQAVRERAEAIRYQRLAEHNRTDPEHQAWHASRRSRAARRDSHGENV